MILPLLASLLLSTALLQAPGPAADHEVTVGGHTIQAPINGNVTAEDSPDNPGVILKGHKNPVRLLSFSPDGSLLASSAWDGSAERSTELRFWDAATGAPIGEYGDSTLTFTHMAFSSDGLRLLLGSSAQQGPSHMVLDLLTGALSAHDITDGHWETETSKPNSGLAGHDSDVTCVAVSSNGKRKVSGGRDGRVRLWDTAAADDRRAADMFRAAATPRLEERVARALTENDEPMIALQGLLESGDVSTREREIMVQIALGFGLRRQAARRAGERAGLSLAPVESSPMAPARYAAPRATAPLLMDGQLDEADWSRAPWSPLFVDIEGAAKPLPTHATRVRMLWDDDFLYVAAELAEPHIWATLIDHDAIIYRDNDFEVFLDPEGDGLWYAEVEINAHGTVFDLQLDRSYRQGGRAIIDWTPADLRSGVTLQGTLNDPGDIDVGWTVELAIPHSSLADHAGVDMPPRPGDVWRINFSRVHWQLDIVDGAYLKRPDTPENNWVWTPQFAINMHKPRHWGFVEFLPAE